MAADLLLVGKNTSATATVTTPGGSVSAGDTIVFVFSYDPSRTISSVSLSGSGADTLTQIASLTTGTTARIGVYIKENATGGASVTATATLSGAAFPTAHLLKATGVATASYDSGSQANGTDTNTPFTVTSNAFAQANNIVVAIAEQNSGTAGAYASSNFTMVSSESDIASFWTCGVAKLAVTATTAVTPSFTRTNSTNGDNNKLLVFALKEAAGGSPATLSAATPSGTLGTSTSATLGATTDVTSGTFYGVVDVAANITGITVSQVKAGQNNAGAAPVGSGNAAVSTVAPSVAVSGLTANTLYSYAVAQNSAGGDSNVLTGTFTTATATLNGVRDYGPRGALKTLLTM